MCHNLRARGEGTTSREPRVWTWAAGVTQRPSAGPPLRNASFFFLKETPPTKIVICAIYFSPPPTLLSLSFSQVN